MIVRKKIAGALLIVAMFIGRANAQEALIKTGNHHYESLCYVKAIDAYEQGLKKKGLKDAERIAAKIKLADSYCKIKDTQNAERIYREVADKGADLSGENSNVMLKYAQVLASNGKYKESQEVYDKYTRAVADDSRGKAFSKLYNDISVLSKNANCYKVDYLTINTNAADFSPAYYKNGLVFVSNRYKGGAVRRVFNWNETPFLDLFYLDDVSAIGGSSASGLGTGSTTVIKNKKGGGSSRYLGNDEYTAPTANDSRTIGTYGGINVNSGLGYGDSPETESERFSGSINSKYHEGPAAFYKDGSKVIFTRNNFNNGKTQRSSDGVNKLKLYMGEAAKDGWKNIKELPFNSNEYSTGHPALSPDEKLLFFASDMPGGFGGTDIYVSRNDGTNWSAPINLGKEVNTKGNEMFPSVDDKGNLYFSSDGLPGLGDLDIFFVQLNGTTPMGRIQNLGSPINSSKDDFGILTDGLRKNGYFSSNRKRGGADDDIYKFDRECELKDGCELIIACYDAETKMPLDNTKVVFEDKDGNIVDKTTDADGAMKLELEAEKGFTFRATRDGYSPNTVTYSTKGCDGEPSRLEIPMSKPKPVVDSVALAQQNRMNQNGQTGTTGTTTTSQYSDNSSSTYTDSGNSTTSGSSTVLSGVTCTIHGRVLSQGSKKSLEGVQVTLKNECDGTTQVAYTDASGKYEFLVNEGCDYTIEGSKDNLGSKGKRVRRMKCNNKGGITADIFMFTQGDVVQVENIYYDYGKCNIRPDARQELDKLVSMMRKYSRMKIELRSHTDSRSDADMNQKISDGRAKAAANYLFKRGISRSRVEYRGYGETMLLNGCSDGVECTEEQHAQNRRTEIKILELK